MERFVPASALGFAQVDSLPDLIDGLTGTGAWQELAPLLGISSQWNQMGKLTDLIGRINLGPDEAVIASRAQYAVALTGLEAETGATPEGPYLHFKPRFTLIVETHSNPGTVAELVAKRASFLADRVYGNVAGNETTTYFGAEIRVFRGPTEGRQIVVAASGSILLIANHTDAIRSCLDALAGRSASLGEDATLNQMRSSLGEHYSVLGYVTESGVQRLAQFAPALFATRFTTDPERLSSIAGLLGHLAKQTTAGLLYSLEFDSPGVTERYVTALRPHLAEALIEPFKPAQETGFESLRLIPRGVEEVTVLRVASPAELPDRILKQIVSRVDTVAALALREFVIALRTQLGLGVEDSLGGAIGDQVTLVKFSDAEPVAMLIPVNDRSRVEPVVQRYLTRGGSSVSKASYSGVEISVSSHSDRQAAALVGTFLVLGRQEQIARVIDSAAEANGLGRDKTVIEALASVPAGASIVSLSTGVEDATGLMLTLARVTRVSDGSRELLGQESMRAALDRLPLTISYTEFRAFGVYSETRSAVGSFGLLGSLGGEN
jgi:hypothetical protein